MRALPIVATLIALAAVPTALAQGFKPEGPYQAMGKKWLITPDEAAHKAPKTRILVAGKSDPGGPKLVIRSPGTIKEVRAPVTIDVNFSPQDGATLDYSTLKVTYIALFDVDITDRIAPYLTATGIYANSAELPLGEHDMEISVKDSQGRRSVERLSFKVVE